MFKVNPRIFDIAKSGKNKTFVTRDVTASMPGERQPTSTGKPSQSVGSVGFRSNHEAVDGLDLPTMASNGKLEKKEPFEIGRNKIRNPLGSSMETSSAVETAEGVPGGGMDTEITIETQSYYQDVLTGFIQTYVGKEAATSAGLNRIYRDIYLNDAVCGNAVELMSTMPWSEFELTGVSDAKKMQLYVSSCERIRVNTLLPSLSIEHMVNGAFCGSLTYDESEKMFTAITPQNLDFVDLLPVPIFGMDPLLTLRLPSEIADFLKSNDERAKAYDSLIPDDLKKVRNEIRGTGSNGASSSNQRGGSLAVPLSADRTIYIPRKGMLKDFRGTSMYRRVIVPWLMEKALMRGTLDQVYKRQRAISHVTAGDEEWKPSNDELTTIANLFLNADLDPVGSIVVTRNGINVNDIREGGNFWRWDQSAQDFVTIKLRAIGVSDSFVSGDFNASTIDATLSVFMEQQRNFRETITREVFYEKLFPIISKENAVTIRKYGTNLETASYSDERMENTAGATLISQNGPTKIYRTYSGELVAEVAAGGSNSPSMNDIHQYVIPEVQWRKRLMPEFDTAYIEIINALKENGIPIPIRMLAAVGGMNVQNLLDSKDDDIKLRTKLGEWVKEISEINKESGLTPPEEGAEGGEFANFMANGNPLRPRGLGSRKVHDPDSPLLVVQDLDSRGRPRHQTSQMKVNAVDRVHRMIARSAVELAKIENAKPEQYNRKKSYSHSKKETDKE